MYAGAGGALGTSTNAITWTLRTSGTTSQINTLIYQIQNGYSYAGNLGAYGTSPGAYTYNISTEFVLPATINNSITPGSLLTAHIKYR
jgi:hypothetical protein